MKVIKLPAVAEGFTRPDKELPVKPAAVAAIDTPNPDVAGFVTVFVPADRNMLPDKVRPDAGAASPPTIEAAPVTVNPLPKISCPLDLA